MIRAQDFLQFLESPEGASLLDEFARRPLRRGQCISSPGQSDNLVFIVRSGRVRVYLASEQRELTLAFLERGDVFSTHTPAWITAAEPGEVLVMGTRAFMTFLTRMPTATVAVIRVLGLLLSQTVDLVETLVFRDAHQRLTHFLVAAARRHHQREGDVWSVPLNLTVTEMALLLGATRQTISAAFSELQKQGIVSRQGRKQLLITDMARLESWGAAD
ncbi:Crp/Fnr family transcriptional regulator [soil metagenome]